MICEKAAQAFRVWVFVLNPGRDHREQAAGPRTARDGATHIWTQGFQGRVVWPLALQVPLLEHKFIWKLLDSREKCYY